METGLDVTSFFEGRNLLLYAGIFMLTGAVVSVGNVGEKKFFLTDLGQRLMPIIPLVIGVLLAVVGVSEPMASKMDAAVFGMISGGIVGHAYKTGRTSVLGYGLPNKVGTKPEVLTEATEPEEKI